MRSIAITLAAGALAIPAVVQAQSRSATPTAASFTGSYTQNFNDLGTALPSNFQIVEFGTNNTVNGNYATYSGTGASGTAGDAYNFGSGGDRALGSITSGSNSPIYYGALFTNGLATTIASLTIGYTGEQWRVTNASTDTLFFEYAVGSAAGDFAGSTGWTAFRALDFLAPQSASTAGNLDGNVAANRQQLNATISGLAIAAGQQFAIRWRDTQVTGSLGNQGLAIDDLAITSAVGAVPEPATWAMMLVGFGLVGAVSRRRRVARSILA